MSCYVKDGKTYTRKCPPHSGHFTMCSPATTACPQAGQPSSLLGIVQEVPEELVKKG
ncbi:hypothetical protein NA56DRAFT_640978 [Hyaloscypha hepaticicola]|uniref:Uncharacterized protein n=1 Tax=Hyaloscypha hepaticicola TaxID=2082293 RepID=A0A2J6QLZ0_9HELO|nr:hypothetical protein NA56DRAFT_640978 [Hyaloscypha hepaticicola]